MKAKSLILLGVLCLVPGMSWAKDPKTIEVAVTNLKAGEGVLEALRRSW